MKIYIYQRKTGIEIIQETTTQSILSDLFTMLVFVVLIGADVLFSIYVARAWIIDVVVAVLFLVYMNDWKSKRQIEIKNKKQLLDILDKAIKQ